MTKETELEQKIKQLKKELAVIERRKIEREERERLDAKKRDEKRIADEREIARMKDLLAHFRIMYQ